MAGDGHRSPMHDLFFMKTGFVVHLKFGMLNLISNSEYHHFHLEE